MSPPLGGTPAGDVLKPRTRPTGVTAPALALKRMGAGSLSRTSETWRSNWSACIGAVAGEFACVLEELEDASFSVPVCLPLRSFFITMCCDSADLSGETEVRSNTSFERVVCGVRSSEEGEGSLHCGAGVVEEFVGPKAVAPPSTDAPSSCWRPNWVRESTAGVSGGEFRDEPLLWRELLGTLMLFSSEREKASMDATDARLTLGLLVISPVVASASLSTFRGKASAELSCMGLV